MKNYSGLRFGYLTVLKKDSNRVNSVGRKPFWICQCDCGNIKSINIQSLKEGRSKSCGCLRKKVTTEKNHKRFDNLISQRFGKLIVISEAESKNGSIYWNCKCDCGNTTISHAGGLRNGNIRSCGCLKKDQPYHDLLGQRFGKLTVIKKIENKKNYYGAMWLCHCDCGNTTEVTTSSLKKNSTKSCGCLILKNGYRKLPEYSVWAGMKNRCYYKNSIDYSNYGGRGIKVCDRWKNSFENFYKDMGSRPDNTYMLDRKDNDDNYEPSNCKWSTPQEQAQNRRNNDFTKEIVEEIKIKYNNGQTVSQLSQEYNIEKYNIYEVISERTWDNIKV